MNAYSNVDGDTSDHPKELLSRLSRWIFNNVIGSLAGLLWCYIVVLQFDPALECPTAGCWRVVAALWTWVVFGVVALPWLSLMAMRTLRRRPPTGDYDYLATRNHEYKPFEMEKKTAVKQRQWEDETLSRARELVARAMGTAWSVGLYSALTATIRQVEYDALQNMGFLARCGDVGVGCAVKGVLILAAFAGAIAALITLFAILVVGLSTRVLARGKLVSPLVVEMMLLLRGNFYYSVASAWTMTLGLLWFAPYELGPAADNAFLAANKGIPSTEWNENAAVRVAFAAARSLTLIILFSHVALNVLPDPPNDDDVEAVADAPLHHCAMLLAFKASAVVVALATNDAAQGIITAYEHSRHKTTTTLFFDFELTLSGFVYGGLLLVLGALCFFTTQKKRKQRWGHQHLDEHQHLVDKRHVDNEAMTTTTTTVMQQQHKNSRFAFLTYTWLVIFATWSPWKRLLIVVYACLGRAVGRIFLLPFQIALALAFSLVFALLQVAVDKLLYLCCGSSESDEPRRRPPVLVPNQRYYGDIEGRPVGDENPFLDDDRNTIF